MEAADAERKASDEAALSSPARTLDEIAEFAPLLAAIMAKQNGVEWQPPSMVMGAMMNELEEMRSVIDRLRQTSGATAPVQNADMANAAA